MTPQELKNSILQLAIQGKLVEQRAEEGTGAELLEKILATKNAEGAKGRGNKLTRSRGVRGGSEDEGISNLPKTAKSHHGKLSALSASPREEIPDDEKPFEIPDSWEWVRWGDLSQSIQYGYNASAKKAGRIKMVRISDIQGGQVLWDTVPYCEINEKDIETYLLQKNDILFARTGGTVGKSFLVKNLPVDAVYAGYLIRTRYSSELSPEYMKYFMESPLYWEQLKNGTIATAQPNCNGKTLARMLLPLPPLAEQKRIVAKIEELLPLVERYEKAWSRLEDFNKRFPADMQKSLLQMAIQGKLVEQRPEEGTGAELLEKILAAKNAEGAKGRGNKLTRSRGVRGGSEDEGISNLPKAAKSHHGKLSASPREEIPDDEKPFDIPESWEFVKVGEVFAHNTGKAMNSSAKFSNKGGAIRKFITTSNLYWDSFDFTNVKEMFFSEEELPRCTVKKNDILVCEGGAYYGRTAIWNYDYDMCFQNHIHRLRSYVKVEEKYFYFVFRLYRETGMMKSQGTAMPGLSSKALHELTIPLPPLAEQKRIVAKLEELLPLCERLKAKSGELSQPELSKRSEV